MTTRLVKNGYFIVEGLNSFSTTFYFYYFYFFTQQQFGFGNRANLVLAAVNGFTYMAGSWWGGRFAQRHGCFHSLKLGFSVMLAALITGTQVNTVTAHVAVMLATVLGMCFTWPALEALVSEGESRAGLQRNVGRYNVVWAGTGALGYFLGGAMLDRFGLGSLYLVPIAVLVVQLMLTLYLERAARWAAGNETACLPLDDTGAIPRAPAEAKMFLRLAWLANPFAYIAINTLVAVMPGVAARLGLSTTLAGICGSVWCFARFGAFFALWFWSGWHYRFRWLLAAFVLLVATFTIILTVPHLTALVVAQIFLGGALGLIYSSSLFYSMDAGDAKGEHGGIHEAAIGLGNGAGPAVGAAALYFAPGSANAGAWAVSALLLCGLAGMVLIRAKARTSAG